MMSRGREDKRILISKTNDPTSTLQASCKHVLKTVSQTLVRFGYGRAPGRALDLASLVTSPGGRNARWGISDEPASDMKSLTIVHDTCAIANPGEMTEWLEKPFGHGLSRPAEVATQGLHCESLRTGKTWIELSIAFPRTHQPCLSYRYGVETS